MKHEWRKAEKAWYLPKEPQVLTLPKLNFVTITGAGDPNQPAFGEHVAALYPVAYDLRMALKRGELGEPYEYTVYPLEGVWSTSDGSRGTTLNKAALTYKIMLRQPDRLTADDFAQALARVQQKKDNPWLSQVKWETYTEGLVVQTIHHGAFDDEPVTFAKLQAVLKERDYRVIPTMGDYWHREIYLTDPRRTAPEKAKTVLRYRVEQVTE
ncbi:GyrI-like domain-containing protein [Levilactobacillus tongjiangensis]|uniref:GyrI-like domain-containing protein n=1 Tax=Levilactobacillus tongjiangensis TaxID=2486023 RepID=A0ABW1SRZ1_9LACO|nr:GyrI-like domain-containing protein [Levilactobacillus tongjiangensis]